MNSIDNAVKQLKINDTIRVKWKPLIRLYGRDTFIGEYEGCDDEERVITVKRNWFDLGDIKCEVLRTVPYDRIESLELLESKKVY